jgi:hypothetical protein
MAYLRKKFAVESRAKNTSKASRREALSLQSLTCEGANGWLPRINSRVLDQESMSYPVMTLDNRLEPLADVVPSVGGDGTRHRAGAFGYYCPAGQRGRSSTRRWG